MHANDALVREFLLLWEQRDTDKLVAACTEDAVWHHRPLPPAVGREHGIREFARSGSRMFPEGRTRSSSKSPATGSS